MASSPHVTVLDYGMANLLNVVRAFEHCGAHVTIAEDAAEVPRADRLVVPGVGAFRDTMDEMTARGFDDAIREYVQTGRPMFGICVGMQMLFDASEEFGEHAGLGILPGRVVAVPSTTVAGEPQRVPHIGWNDLVEPEGGRDWRGTLLAPVDHSRSAVYFVHSYAAVPENHEDRLADCYYGGHRISSAVQHDQVMATQFHPERSGELGLRLISLFQSL